MLSVFTDGGSRGNPGQAAIGVYITDESEKNIYSFGERLGVATNNVAEYKAVIAALSWLVNNKELVSKYKKINFYLDSLLLVSQLNGIYKIKNPQLKELYFTVREKETLLLKGIQYFHVPREKNKNADRLVNMALDNKL